MKVNVPEDYVPSAGEVDNLVYLCCKYTAGWQMRACDLAVVKMMAPDPRGPDGIERLARQACEYVWDHICGEPEGTSAEKLLEHMSPILEEWYLKTTPEDRAKTD